MVATVGSISIDLSTNAVKFADGFKKNATTVERESSRMARAIKGVEKASSFAKIAVGGFVGGIVAGGAIAALGSLSGALGRAKQALDEFEAIGNMARTVGLSTDALQALSFAALETDVEIDKLNAGLGIFAKNVGLAKEGTGALYSGLKNLNPELLRSILNAKDQEERLRLVADAMNKTTDATKQAALATTVFGKGGLELVRIFGGGAAAIEEFQRQARELGVIVSAEDIQNAGMYGDKIDRLNKITEIYINKTLVELAPAIAGGAQQLANFAKAINETATAIENFKKTPSLDSFLNAIGFKLEEGGFADKIRDRINELRAQEETRKAQLVVQKWSEAAQAIRAEIVRTQEYLDRLYAVAAKGEDVKLYTGEAEEKIDILNAKLLALFQTSRTAFAQAFRASEIASMTALAAFRASQPGAAPADVPAVPGLPRVIGSALKGDGTRQDEEANRWGVVRNLQNGIPRAVENVEEATYAGADQVSGGISELSSDIRDYFGNAVYELGSDIRSTNDLLGKSINYHFATLVDGVRTGIVSGMAQAERMRGSFDMGYEAYAHQFDTYPGAPRNTDYDAYAGQFADGGSFTVGGNQTGDSSRVVMDVNAGERVTVTPANAAQVVNLYYQAAPGESERTSRQNARAMWEMLQRENARA